MDLEWTIEVMDRGLLTEMMMSIMNGYASGKCAGRMSVLSDAVAIELLRMRISASGPDT